jgi:hypothetical protein
LESIDLNLLRVIDLFLALLVWQIAVVCFGLSVKENGWFLDYACV